MSALNIDTKLITDTQYGSLRSYLRQHDCRTYLGWATLIVYVLFLVYRARHGGADGETANGPVWELRDPRRLAQAGGGLVFRALAELAYFVPVGFVATVALRGNSARLRRFPVRLPALAIGIVFTVLVHAVKSIGSWYIGAAIGMVFPLLGCCLGAWAGTTWFRGWRSRLWFVPKIFSLVLLLFLCAGTIAHFSLEDMPLPFETSRVTSAEKCQLVHLFSSKSPNSLKEGQTHTLRLAEREVNALLSWVLGSESSKHKARVTLERECVSLRMSVLTLLGEERPHYLNLKVTSGVEIEDGNLRLHVDRCRIGAVEVPYWLLRSLCPLVTSFVRHDQRVKPFLDATRGMMIEPDSIQLTYGHLDLHAGLRKSFLRPVITSEELLASTQTHVDSLLLLAIVRQLFDSSPSFDLCLKTVFALARDRSTQSDPVMENQAAILALGVLLGHPQIEELLGFIVVDGDDDTAREVLRRVAIRGRFDWVMHFCVSAAIVVLSDETVSDATGLLKEEFDASANGSGFSFADLLADRAGTNFAIAATRDEAAARTMQNRLAYGFRIEEIFPPADGLPEGISDAELQSRYGGVNGEGYRRLAQEIERRIATCVAYQ